MDAAGMAHPCRDSRVSALSTPAFLRSLILRPKFFLMKRTFDILFSLTVLILTALPMALLCLAVAAGMGRPVFFRQKRPGKDGEVFEMIKFRTMTSARGADGRLLPDAQRLTPLGRFLRRSSLDEFPEFINVLKGEMSVVGPRPLLVQYLPRYSPEQARRHEVKPGITGWAQVNGRNAISWEDKFRLDVWYVDNRTLLLDLRIIALTVKKVFFREGISAAGDATMPEFLGKEGAPGK
jgi:lipopolysaccharide/colanic/teichoic acid biosynthesis glycosyltransferase